MSSDPQDDKDINKKAEEMMSASPNVDTSIKDSMASDGFGSINNELEVDKEAIAKAEEEAKKAEESVKVVDGPVIATDEKAEKKEKSKKRTSILAIIAFLLLISCGALAYVMFGANSNDRKPDVAGGSEGQQKISSYRLESNSLSDFDLRFLQLEGKEENVIYSPLSIKYALAMLKDGADGDTKKQIEDIIGDYKSKKYINGKNISLANAMFVENGFKDQVLDSYIDGLKTNYNADVVFDSFKDAKNVNKWISDKTLGLVDNALSDADVTELSFALVNALAIDQYWENQLQCEPSSNKVKCLSESLSGYSADFMHENYTQSIRALLDPDWYESMKFGDLKNRKAVTIGASFNNYDILKDKGEDTIREKVTEEYKKWLQSDEVKEYIDSSDYDIETNVEKYVDRYIKELNANYGKEYHSTDFYFDFTDEVKVFAKDLKEYNGTTLQYVGIMPKNGELIDFINRLTAEKASEYINGLKPLKVENFKKGVITRIDATIPMFKYDYKLNFQHDLEELGIKDVFVEGESNLTKLAKNNTFIKVAKHMATIDFSNDGIKAGAASIAGGLGGGGPHFEYLWDVPVEEIDLSFNRPFIYLIRDKNTGEVWFVGSVYEPTEKKTNK